MPAQSDSSGTNQLASCPYFLPGGDTFKFGVKLLRKRNKGSEIRIASQIEANRKSIFRAKSRPRGSRTSGIQDWQHCHGCFHSGPRETLKIVLARRLHFGWC